MRLKFRDGEMTLKYLIRDVDRYGQERIYVRRKGFKKVKLTNEPGSAAFMEEYRQAIAGTQKTTTTHIIYGSFRWLCVEYKKSPAFAEYSEKTQGLKRALLDKLCDIHGDNPAKQIQRRHLQKIVDDMADTPFAANNILKTLNPMFKWAVKREHLETNPVRDVERIKAETEGHHTWTPAEMRQYLKKHPLKTKAGLAFAIFFFTGCRKSDAVKMGRQMETDEGTLRWRETKGGEKKTTEVPISPEFRKVLDLHHAGDRLHYLVTSFNKPFTANGFGNWFRDRCDEAGLSHCSAHGIRKGGATTAADHGASDFDLMSFFNWASLKEADTYTRKANRKRLAANTSKLLTLKNIKGPKVSNT